jgi:hypothetical protein
MAAVTNVAVIINVVNRIIMNHALQGKEEDEGKGRK